MTHAGHLCSGSVGVRQLTRMTELRTGAECRSGPGSRRSPLTLFERNRHLNWRRRRCMAQLGTSRRFDTCGGTALSRGASGFGERRHGRRSRRQSL